LSSLPKIIGGKAGKYELIADNEELPENVYRGADGMLYRKRRNAANQKDQASMNTLMFHQTLIIASS